MTSVFTPGGVTGSKVGLHRAQAAARNSDAGVRIARLLIGKKLQGQCEVLEWLTDPGRQVPLDERDLHQRMRSAAPALRSIEERIGRLNNVEAIIEAERAGAEIYWTALSGTPLSWKPKQRQEYPSIG